MIVGGAEIDPLVWPADIDVGSELELLLRGEHAADSQWLTQQEHAANKETQALDHREQEAQI